MVSIVSTFSRSSYFGAALEGSFRILEGIVAEAKRARSACSSASYVLAGTAGEPGQ